MSMELLNTAQAQALNHMNLCRKVRSAIIGCIDDANKARTRLPNEALDLHDHIVTAERAATDAYGAACAAVDAHLDQLAGTTKEPRP